MTPILSDRAAHWLTTVFSAKAAMRGHTVRRSIRDIDAMIQRDVFLQEVRRRGFSAVQNGDQIIVFCNNEPIKRLV
ncbi:MAG: N-(5'-phosphoribosyl)anthranilate isomerase [Pseudomonadota bacterium]